MQTRNENEEWDPFKTTLRKLQKKGKEDDTFQMTCEHHLLEDLGLWDVVEVLKSKLALFDPCDFSETLSEWDSR